MFSYDTKNTLAKITIMLWIVVLLGASAFAARLAVSFDVNTFFNLSGTQMLPQSVVQEIRIILLMLAVSIVGGISFMIKDFYRAVKYSNLYNIAYTDYRSGHIALSEFQRLVTVDIYTGRFNYSWMYWFLVQPVLSSALGLIAFFIARSGLGVLQGTATIGDDITIQSLYLYAVFTFLAGFSSHKFIAWLDRLADKIFSTTLPEKKAEMKAGVTSASTNDRAELRSEVAEDSELAADAFTAVSVTSGVKESAWAVAETAPTSPDVENGPAEMSHWVDTPHRVDTPEEVDQTGFSRSKMKKIR